MADPGFPSRSGAPIPKVRHQPIIWPTFSPKLHENLSNWTEGARVLGASPPPGSATANLSIRETKYGRRRTIDERSLHVARCFVDIVAVFFVQTVVEQQSCVRQALQYRVHETSVANVTQTNQSARRHAWWRHRWRRFRWASVHLFNTKCID